MNRPLTTNELRTMQMMIGQQVMGFVFSSVLLGHATLRGTTVYAKGEGPVGDFVYAVMGNQTADSLEALDALIKAFPEVVGPLGVSDPSDSTEIDSVTAWIKHCTEAL